MFATDLFISFLTSSLTSCIWMSIRERVKFLLWLLILFSIFDIWFFFQEVFQTQLSSAFYEYSMILCSLLDARRELTESHEITLVCLSVCPSARPSVRSSLSCSKTGSLVFLDIIHDDSWPWYQAAQISAKWAKIGSKTSFFAIFSILIH